jgi:signal peptidase
MTIALILGRRMGGIVVGLFLATILAIFVAPPLLGHPALTVSSGSMTPALRVGDLVIEDRILATEAREGDIVTYSHPTRAGQTVTHRVEKVLVQGGVAWFTTRGDANPAPEEWSVPADGTIGRVHIRIAGAGFLMAWARSALGYTFLILVPIGGLAGTLLVRIWRRRPEEDPA